MTALHSMAYAISHHAQFLQMLTGNRRELSRATWRSYVTVILVSKWGLFLTISVFLLQRRYRLKVIPLFCTAHPLLRITLRHPRWRRFFLLARKEQTRAAFAEVKLLFAIIMPQFGWQVPGLLSKNKKIKEICVIPKSAVVFHFAAVELWNF